MDTELERKLNDKSAEHTQQTPQMTLKTVSEGFASLTKRLLTVSRGELRELETKWRNNR